MSDQSITTTTAQEGETPQHVSQETGTYKLSLRGPKYKVGDVTTAQVSHLAFAVRGHLIEVPLDGTPIEVTRAQYETIMAQELPSEAYSWQSNAEGEEVSETPEPAPSAPAPDPVVAVGTTTPAKGGKQSGGPGLSAESINAGVGAGASTLTASTVANVTPVPAPTTTTTSGGATGTSGQPV